MVTKTGWYNKNMTGNPPKYESHRHSLASRGIKTSAPKGVKGVSSAFSPTPNFDMVKKGRGNISIGDKIKIISDNELYDEYRKKVWVITHIARSQEEHQGYDKAVGGNLVSAEGLPFSLYDWEFEKTNKKTDMIIGKGIDFPMDEFHKGIRVETEHSKTVNRDPIAIARIALDHLEEDKEYYRKLAIMEKNVHNPKYDMYKNVKRGKMDMSLADLSKKLKKASKGVSKKAHDISKNIEKHNIERQEKAEKKLLHDIEVAKEELKLKKMQAKSDLLGMKHKESVQRQRQELARINKELEKGTSKEKAKIVAHKAGKEGLKIAGLIAKGVAKEVKIAISTEPPKRRKK